MNQPTRSRALTIAVVVALAAIAYFAWQYFNAPAPAPQPAPMAVTPMAPAPVVVVSAPELPGIQHPLDTMTPTATVSVALPALADSDKWVSDRLAGVLSRKNILTFLQLDGFVRRVVATVDNLGRESAPPKLWPVVPTPERFTTLKAADGTETIHPDNGQRYVPLVLMLESVDSAKAVALYRSLYPLFQQAYEELGFPGKYFNDRLVAVLDQLIATPVPTAPVAVQLVAVKGSVPSLRPWVRYEYANAEMEALSAGQKILLRSGPVNQRRLIAKLQEVRRLVAKTP
jgi:hypothetical protein